MTTPTYFKVDKFSHHFVVSQISPITGPTILGFVRDYIQYGIARVNGVYKRMPLKVFAARDKSTNSFRLHNGVWDEFWRYCSNNNISKEKIDITEWAHAPAHPIEIPVRQGWVPKDYQEPIIEYLLSPKPSHVKMIEIQPGAGKLQPLDALIKVPGGWATMGSMQVGTKVIAKDGTTTSVTGVYPNGKQPIYRLTFADGRSTLAGPDHLWRVFYKNTSKHKRWRVIDTWEVKRLLKLNSRVYIDLCDSEQNADIDLPIDPYVLGLLLGNGGLTSGSISYTTQDQCTVDYIASTLPYGMVITFRERYHWAIVARPGFKNTLISKLKDLGLWGKLSYYKFIPWIYLSASTHQRQELLKGLMDSDGTATERGVASYSSSSEQLAKDVQYLVRSLGGMAAIASRIPNYSYKGEKKQGVLAYNVNIRVKVPSKLFRVKRKLDRTNDNNQYAWGLKLRVSSVEYVGEMQTQCISIAHPDKLYVTDDFIVTHNTFCAMAALAQYSTRFVAVLKPKYVEKWVDDVVKITESVKSDVLVVAGQAGLMKLLAAALSNELEERVVIVSNRTLQNWISLYEEKGDETLTLGYSCRPHEFFPLLKAGTRLVDEVHEDFHLNFKIDLYTHVPVSISLSATLISDDPFVAKMQEIAYPKSIRYTGLPYDRYIHSFAVMYNVAQPELIRTTEYGSTTYSHHVFEQSIMKHKHFLVSYLAMIKDLAERYFFSTFQGGDRLLIYCTSIKMCTIVTDYLLREYPNVDIRRYVEKDPYENLMNARVSVSTIQSAGTGHDIAGLMTVIMTPAVSSRGSNIQGYGRLRKVPDRQTQFIYTTCTDVPKHIKYHEQREMLLKIMAKEHFLLENQYTVG